MKFKIKPIDDHQVEIITEIKPEIYSQFKAAAARKISSESKLPGFRPGKAPYDIVKSIYGEEMIEERAVELLINDIYPQILKDAEIKAFGPGKLEEIISKDPLKLKFSVPLEPTIEIGDYRSIRHKYKKPSIKKDEIESVLQKLQINYATAEEVERPSEIGDLISIRINAFLTKPDENQNPHILKDTPHQVIIGDTMEEEQFPYKEFSNQLVKLSSGDKKEFSYKYHKDSSFENLRSKEVKFEVLVENVKKLIKPEMDDSFASTMGFDSFQSLEESIMKQLEDSKTEDYDNQYFNEVFEKLGKKAKIHYPPQMLEDEIEEMIKNFESNLARQNLDLDTYLKINNLKREEFVEKEIKPAAVKKLQESLILEEISRQEKIELDQSVLRQEFTRSMMQMQAAPNYKKLQKEFTIKRLSNLLAMQTANRLMNKRTLDRIKAIANEEIEAVSELSEKGEEISDKSMMDPKI